MRTIGIIALAGIAVIGIFAWILGDNFRHAVGIVRGDMRESIEGLIGKYRLKVAKIDDAIARCEEVNRQLVRREAHSTIELEYATRQLAQIESDLDSARQNVLRLAELIELEEPVTLANGQTLSPENLAQRARVVEVRFTTLRERYQTTKNIVETYTAMRDLSNHDRLQGQFAVELLREKHNLLAAKIESLEAIREMQVDEADHQTVFADAERFLEETMKEIDKEILYTETVARIVESDRSLNQEITELTRDSNSIVTDLRNLVGED